MVQLSIVVPTYNEVDNLIALRDSVAAALGDVAWELLIVDDDSPDGTAAAARQLAQSDPRVRCLHRIGRRGLVSACIEGMLASSAPLVAVMDGDLQHDERLLPRMLQMLDADPQLDIVVGSRYVEGGTVGAWNRSRALLSRWATQLSAVILKADVKDPMSGFFMIRHASALRSIRAGMSGVGFKVLLDLFASAPTPLRFRELPYRFRNRVAGQSKLDTVVAWEYVLMLLDRLLGGAVPIRFIAFSLVGAVGFAIHMTLLVTLFSGFAWSFSVAQTTATIAAMTSNFMLNNVLTYRDLRLRGWKVVSGWVSFLFACSVGIIANVGIAAWLYQQTPSLWIASAVAGVLIGAVWNYAITNLYIWNKPRAS
jgi:dolichol-phosphate mannosyltransferase